MVSVQYQSFVNLYYQKFSCIFSDVAYTLEMGKNNSVFSQSYFTQQIKFWNTVFLIEKNIFHVVQCDWIYILFHYFFEIQIINSKYPCWYHRFASVGHAWKQIDVFPNFSENNEVRKKIKKIALKILLKSIVF